jgi:predicted amidophosphoribosyltransferase
VIPVPLHPKKRRKRGYNQVDDFGKKLAAHLGAEFTDSILLKSRHTPTQTTKSRWHRWKYQQGEYKVERPDLIRGKRILLVDDVITTGATLESCAKALQKTPGVQVYVGAMACVA